MGLYEKNLKALGKRHPDLVELIESIEINEDEIKVLSTESGNHRVLYKKENGEYVSINSGNDQTERANKTIDQFGRMENEGIVLLFGFELGYFAEELLKRFEKGHILFVYEAIPEIFKVAIMTKDISDLLASENVNIVLGENVENYSLFFAHYDRINNGKFWVIKDHSSVGLNENAYERFYKRIKEEKRLLDTCNTTLRVLGREFINTLMLNIPSILTNAGVDKLKDIFKGRPAIVVSAGPSIDKNLHLLKKTKGQAVIIAVDAVVPTLLPCNIIPDIIVGIDPGKCNINMFKDNPLLNDVPFICIGQYTSEIVRLYPGPLFVNSVPNNVVHQWLARFWKDKGHIECFGGSVAHLAFSAAEFMGCDVIAFVGQDLSYKKLQYSKGYCDASGMLTENHSNSVPTQNIFGENVYARLDFIAFKISFENKIKDFKGKVVNATEDGLPIEGAIPMRLIDFVEDYCDDLSRVDTFSILSGLFDERVNYNLDGLITEVIAGRDKFRDIRKTSKMILKYIEKVKRLKGKGKQKSREFHSILNKLDTLVEEAKDPLHGLIVAYHYDLGQYLKKQSVQKIGEIEDKGKQLDKKLELGEKYYIEVVKAIDLFDDRLDKLIDDLQKEKKVVTILTDESLEHNEKSLKVGMIYKNAGMVSKTVKYLESAVRKQEAVGSWQPACRTGRLAVGSGIDGNPQPATRNAEVYVSLAEMYIKQFRFYEAKEMLESVISWQLAEDRGQEAEDGRGEPMCSPTMVNRQFAAVSSQKVTKLLEICNEKITAWEERKKEMEKLLKDAEVNYGGHLESGNFYIRVKDFERAGKAFLKAVNSRQSSVISDQSLTLMTNDQHTNDKKNLIEAYYGLTNTCRALDKLGKSVDTLTEKIEIEAVNTGHYCHSK